MRLLAQGCGHGRPGALRWAYRPGLAQHPLHSGAADLDAGAEHLPGYGARAELRLRAQLPEFVDGPTKRVVGPIPYHGSSQQAWTALAFASPDPGADRIAVYNKVLCGLPDAPSPQSSQLQDGQSLFGWIVRSPMRWEPLALSPEELQFSAEQISLCGLLISLDQQPHNRRTRRSEPCPSQLVGLAQHDGHGVNQTQHSGRGK